MTTTSNAYCAALGISPPRIDDAKASPDANYYSLLIIALLERGGPMTLAEAAARFAAAEVTSSANEALAALKRCKPARAPIYRDGDSYALDPHDDEVDFWLFRLGLRPARSAPLQAIPNASAPLPSTDQPLTVAALDEAWREGVPNSWSAQRVAVAVLDAHQSPMSSDDVIVFVSARSRWSPLRPESAQFWRSGAIVVREDGVWELDRTHEVVRSAREAVCNRVSDIRRWAATRPDTVAMEAHRQRIERERTAHARELAAMRRVLVHAFPATQPRAVALVDVGAREVTTFLSDEITPALQRLSEYDIIGAVNVQGVAPRAGCRPRQTPVCRTRPSTEDHPAQSPRPNSHDYDGASHSGVVWYQPAAWRRTDDARGTSAAVHIPSSDAGWKQTQSRSTRSISTGVCMAVFVSAGASSTRCCPHPGFIETSPRCTTC